MPCALRDCPKLGKFIGNTKNFYALFVNFPYFLLREKFAAAASFEYSEKSAISSNVISPLVSSFLKREIVLYDIVIRS